MQRREFIKVMAAGSGLLLLDSCGGPAPRALEGWRGPDKSEQDIRMTLLSYAILAANPHNKQPWLIELTGPLSFDLYVDPDRLLPETDPPYRQIHIGQGTFLENLALAAPHHGYRAEIRTFPQGQYSNTALERKPVASILLHKESEVARDPLFNQILARRSNKRAYDNQAVKPAELEILQSIFSQSPFSLTIDTSPERREALAQMMIKAMIVESSGRQRDMETLSMFRFNDEEMEKHRDGFGFGQAGLTGMKRFMVEMFSSREAAEELGSSWIEETIKLTTAQAESAMAYGWIISTSNSRLDQVLVGRVYERLNLQATALGLAMHPMSQILQEYEDMIPLQRTFRSSLNLPAGHTVQMLFRLGHAEPTPHAPRRSARGLLQT